MFWATRSESLPRGLNKLLNNGNMQNWSIKAFYYIKNYENWCKYFKDMDIWMQWPRLILQVKTQIVVFIARWRHLCNKCVQYKFNRRV